MSDQVPSRPTPRGRRQGERRLTPRPGSGSAMWYILGFLLLAAVGQALLFSMQGGETISYSEFKTYVRTGKIQDVTVTEDRVRGNRRGDDGKPKPFQAVRIEDPKLLEDLEQHNIKYTGEVPN